MAKRLNEADDRSLRAAPLFRAMPEVVIQPILSASTLERAPARHVIFQQGEPASHMFFLLDGWLKVTRNLPNGLESVIGLFTRGESVAEAVALTGQTYPARGEAVTPLRYLALPAQAARDAIEHQPKAALAMISSTALHLRQLMVQIEQLKARRAPERTLEFLLSLTEVRQGATQFLLPFDKNLIAARLGMQPESLSRTFAGLRSMGVKVTGSQVRIEDVGRILAALDGPLMPRSA